MSQTQLAQALGLQSQGSVSGWEKGDVEPERSHVFQMEELLDLEPGFLSSILGYGPPVYELRGHRHQSKPADIRRAIAADDKLSKDAKSALLGLYRALTAGTRGCSTADSAMAAA
jgi:transcriptional regulator with XRE-family HTH domain